MNHATSALLGGISIVCVYNNPGVRQECLDDSIAAYAGGVEVDYIPVDNTGGQFASAGAALNHGVRRARHDVVILVHQDVYLHSIDRLAAAGALLLTGEWALLGANGVTASGENVGRMRDRTQLIGRHAVEPLEVDSVDEVLFMARRDLLGAHPLSEEVELAWHAYAVEYGLRLRRMGERIGAADLAITHNSLTVNLDRLDAAHRRVAESYPEHKLIYTTCGIIGSRLTPLRGLPVLRNHRWRLRWLRHSLLARRIRSVIDAPVVLSDIRHEVDLLAFSTESPLHLLDLDRSGGFAEYAPQACRLTRHGRPVIMRAVRTLGELHEILRGLPDDTRVLVTGVERDELAQLASGGDRGRDWVVGIQPGSVWALGGAAARDLPPEWSRSEAVPLGAGRGQSSAAGRRRAASTTTRDRPSAKARVE